MNTELVVIITVFTFWVGILGIYDWKYRGARRSMFVPIFVMVGAMAVYDIWNHSAALIISTFFTILLVIISSKLKIGVIVEHVGNGDIDSKVTKGISDGDVYVLAGLIWVIIYLTPLFAILGISFGLTFLYEFRTGKFVPYVTMLAFALLATVPFILTGVFR